MKIAVVVWHLNVKGGTQRQALELSNFLKRKGHEVRVFCAWFDRDRCYTDLLEGLDVKFLHGPEDCEDRSKLRWIIHPSEPLLTGDSKRLARMMDGDFDVVNCHDHCSYRVGFFYKERTGAPIVWTMNDLPRSLRKAGASPSSSGPVGFAQHCAFGGPVASRIDLRKVREVDRILVLDERNGRMLSESTGLESTIVRSGLDLSQFVFRERSPTGRAGTFKVFAVGVFFPHRRFEDLVTAMDLLRTKGRDVTLEIAGSETHDPSYAAKVRGLVSAGHLEDRIRLLGAISEDELVEKYREADAFAFPNSPQTWGLSVFEAMACGAPAVVSRGCGASEVLSDGENALLVAPEHPDEISAAISRLMDEADLYSRLSRVGRKFVEKNITWENYGSRMMDIFEQVAKKRGEKA